MSYDLAVWDGERPADDETALRVFRDLCEQYIDTDANHPPTERIAAYVTALLERWCDLTDDDHDTSPWSTGPLIGEARGPLIYFPMRYSMAEEASAFAASLAHSMGLVCFDPQVGALSPCDARSSLARHC
ncbi:hypothetical protein [Streptomyces sp. NBC_01445]|uniref:hypothetical protein n=1 Tax=Streptomyces sp. NBC_01445 TaxID=2903869 RepID=UPI002DDB24D3|nr:hypothetical protein [Streptomyces sp. NBC_01445]WSE11532.1 hypothetical protein OG574_51075 [Streptomyces sp. NBC_01445]